MVPDLIQSRYEIYKKDTNAVAIWLTATVKRFGYAADLLTSTIGHLKAKQKAHETAITGRLKGKARKAAKVSQTGTADEEPSQEIPTDAPASGPTMIVSPNDYISLAE